MATPEDQARVICFLASADADFVTGVTSRVAREVARCQTALAQIGEAQTQAMGGLLERDRPPIWSTELWARARTAGFRDIHDSAMAWWAEFDKYLRDPANGLMVHVGLFVILAALLWAGRRWTHRSAAEEGASFATAVFDRPFSAALLISLISTAAPGPLRIVASGNSPERR